MRRTLLLSLVFILELGADGTAIKMNDEIDHLLHYVKFAGCQYIRNGDAHEGAEAVGHITKKYDYYRDDIHSAEDFIRLSATKSLMSGSRYHIRCPGEKSVESAHWLEEELTRYRDSKKRDR